MESDFAGRSRISKNWLFAPPLRGAPAWAVTAAAIAIPSLLRIAIPPHLMDQGCTTYFPFVVDGVDLVRMALCIAGCNWKRHQLPYDYGGHAV